MDKILSIVIPTYNAENYLDKGLTSLIIEDEELFAKTEVLIVNDGTPDNSVAVAQKYVDMHPDVFKIINKENGGHGSAINVGTKNASGKYFKVLDADDWVDNDGYTEFVKLLCTTEADAVFTPFDVVDISKDHVFPMRSKPREFGVVYTMNDVMDQWQKVHELMHFWGVCYNTEFYRSLNYDLLEGVFYEDQEYTIVPTSRAKSVVFLPTKVYMYRVGDVNQSVFGDTQVKRRSHLEAVLDALIAQYPLQDQMAPGGDRFYRKKTAMMVTSYYQIMLIKNKKKKDGRAWVADLNAKLASQAPDVYAQTEKKCKGFMSFNYLHIPNSWYEFWAPKIVGTMRNIKPEDL